MPVMQKPTKLSWRPRSSEMRALNFERTVQMILKKRLRRPKPLMIRTKMKRRLNQLRLKELKETR